MIDACCWRSIFVGDLVWIETVDDQLLGASRHFRGTSASREHKKRSRHAHRYKIPALHIIISWASFARIGAGRRLHPSVYVIEVHHRHCIDYEWHAVSILSYPRSGSTMIFDVMVMSLISPWKTFGAEQAPPFLDTTRASSNVSIVSPSSHR